MEKIGKNELSHTPNHKGRQLSEIFTHFKAKIQVRISVKLGENKKVCVLKKKEKLKGKKHVFTLIILIFLGMHTNREYSAASLLSE